MNRKRGRTGEGRGPGSPSLAVGEPLLGLSVQKREGHVVGEDGEGTTREEGVGRSDSSPTTVVYNYKFRFQAL
jgi:hypothetical protein